MAGLPRWIVSWVLASGGRSDPEQPDGAGPAAQLDRAHFLGLYPGGERREPEGGLRHQEPTATARTLSVKGA